jgi:hypothetical protein
MFEVISVGLESSPGAWMCSMTDFHFMQQKKPPVFHRERKKHEILPFFGSFLPFWTGIRPHCKEPIPKVETNIPRKELRGHSPNFHIHVSVSDLYRKCMDRSREYINRSQTHECGNGTEVAQFPEKERINGIFIAVRLTNQIESGSNLVFR